ncbi:MAG: hypothetical protein QXY50_07885, partial [Candidatus Caldarchaeum sp.]
TGSISMLADVSSGLEPQYALVYRKQVSAGTFYYVDQAFDRYVSEKGLPREEVLKKVADNGGSAQGLAEIPPQAQRVFVTALDIPWWDHLRAQHEVQSWVDASVSKTINMPSWVAVEDVLNAFVAAHGLGLKGLTVYRDGSKSSQVLTTPTQRHGAYAGRTENKTLELLKSLGIDVVAKPSEALPPPPLIHTFCPVCGGRNMVFQEGCERCLDCSWSSCVVA